MFEEVGDLQPDVQLFCQTGQDQNCLGRIPTDHHEVVLTADGVHAEHCAPGCRDRLLDIGQGCVVAGPPVAITVIVGDAERVG